MFYFNLEQHDFKKVHFIGIGGVSMSGIAELLKDKGYAVTGSDRGTNKYIAHLEYIGIPVTIGQKAENITDQDLFIFTDAIPETNAELIAARATGHPVVSRGRFLGALMRNYRRSIAVSGSHGKSTTTSIITKILLEAQADPTILLGGSLDEIAGNVHTGSSDLFLAEACEYKGNIRYYYPQYAVILNIDEDHLDYFKNLDHIVEAFISYMKNLGEHATALINLDDENCRKLLPELPCKAVTFAMQAAHAMYHVQSITFDALGHPTFEAVLPDGTILPLTLKIIGRYNLYNVIAAVAVTHQAGIPLKAIKAGIEAYTPLHRRMEILGTFNDATVMTDYGHHPKEIRSTLEALSEHKVKRLICVFQPHTYSRTLTLMDDFAEAFYRADAVVITDIMGAREVDDGSVHATDLVKRLKDNGVNVAYCPSFNDVEDFLCTRVEAGDLILTTGCGNIDELAYHMVGEAQHLSANM